jgi:hypothetical protein
MLRAGTHRFYRCAPKVELNTDQTLALTLRPNELAELAANPAAVAVARPADGAVLAAAADTAEVDVGMPNDVIAGTPITCPTVCSRLLNNPSMALGESDEFDAAPPDAVRPSAWTPFFLPWEAGVRVGSVEVALTVSDMMAPQGHGWILAASDQC